MRALADTQILIWYVIEPAKLSAAAVCEIQAAAAASEALAVSAFSMVEVAYAVEKAKNPLSSGDAAAIRAVLDDPHSPFEVVPVDLAIALEVARVPRDSNADSADRIIVATAHVLGLPIMTAESKTPRMTNSR